MYSFSSELVVEKSSGKLEPLGRNGIKITFQPSTSQTLNAYINVIVKDGNSSAVKAVAVVVAPKVRFFKNALLN